MSFSSIGRFDRRTHVGRHAVVIGGGVAGLLAARVLSGHFDRVTVLETGRSEVNEGDCRERPQLNHVHTLLMGGLETLEHLFPDIRALLFSAGAVSVDFAHDFCFYHYGVKKARFASELIGTMQSRSLLESLLRDQIRRSPNVNLHYEARVTELGREPGARLSVIYALGFEAKSVAPLLADFVVDASGRHSRMPEWLKRLGLGAPAEEKVEVRIGYASRQYFIPEDTARDWKALVVFPKAPNETRGGYVFPIEHGSWLVSLFGYLGDYPGHREDQFLEFSASLPRRDLYAAIHQAQPLSDIATFRFPHQFWRHYEHIPEMPANIVVMGDSACSLDPLFGQGMTLCAKQAWLLHICLCERKLGVPCNSISRVFHKRQAKLIWPSWMVTSSEAYRYPNIEGLRSPLIRFLQWYAGKVFHLSADHSCVYRAFLRMMHLRNHYSMILTPRVFGRVLGATLAGRAREFRRKRKGRNDPTEPCVNPVLQRERDS